MLRHIQINLKITSASDIEALPLLGSDSHDNKGFSYKIYVSNPREAKNFIKNSLIRDQKVKLIINGYAVNSDVYQRNDLNPRRLKI